MKIAVVGLSSLFPGSSDVEGFFQDILAGRDRITKVPRTHWLIEDYYDPDPRAPDKIYVDRGGFLDPIDFDPMRWGIPPSILPATDTTQLLSLVVAERALADAFGESAIDRERVSVMLGVTGAQKLLGEMNSRLQRPIWASALREMGMSEAQVDEACARISARYVPWQESTFPGVLGNVVAGRIANRLDLGGTNCVTDAACASAFGALNMALNELGSRQSDVVICGGADTMNDPFMFECFAKTTALSKSGDVRPFDASADGTMLGEGVAMVVLMRLEDAIAKGRAIHAVIRGLGTSSDGRAKSVYAPLPSGQAKALRRAYERAGYGPETVELVEAHGTGTAAGDAAELEALVEVFAGTPRSCALGSVKSQIGHTKAAAGAAGLIKAVLALRHGVIPPTIKVQTPTDALAKDGPFYLSTRARPWIRASDHPRRASVSAFGFGGSNFHVTLEEHAGEGLAPRVPMGGAELVVLGGEAKALAAEVRALLRDARRPGMLRWLAADTQGRYAGGPARLAIVADGEDDLAGKLEMALPFLERGESFSAPGGLEVSVGEAAGEPVALMFPGQGSQHLEMGAALAMRFEAARAVWDRAADLALGEVPLHQVVFPPPTFDAAEREAQAARLTATEWAQPALGAASAAMLAVLRELGVEAAAFCGHSFGEVSALFAAGAISEGDLLCIAKKRGELMRDASSIDGAMIAVSARLEDVRAALSSVASLRDGIPTPAGDEGGRSAQPVSEYRHSASLRIDGCDVVVANHNHPEQVVLSGATSEIERAEAKLRERKLRFSRLEVATAFHSPLVAAACAPFAEFLAAVPFTAPSAPVYSNATAAPHGEDARAALAGQIAKPVRFVDEIEAMHAAGIRTFVEVGPGSVLSSLVSRILKGRPHRAVALDHKGKGGVRAFLSGLAKLVAAGVPMQLGALGAGVRAPIDPRTIVEPRMTVKLSGANAGKPYPPPSDAPPVEAVRPMVIGGSADGETMAAPKRVPKAPPPVSAPCPEPSVDSALVQAFLETQRQSAEAHAAYQRAVSDAHAAFLRSSEAAMTTIASLLAGAPAPDLGAAMRAALPPAPIVAPPIVASMVAPPVVAPPVVAPPVIAPPVIAPAPDPVIAAPELDLSALMMEVVAEKTGYPATMLAPSMELESDLGVDSIKRVEILAALRERAPGLPELDPAELGKLRTLEEITRLLGATSSALPRPLPHATAEVSPAIDLSALMMEVVAEKTGYPAAMLSPSMELESDLGVDSIKRVEILAALRERAPGLPELDPAELGKLRTLEEITKLLGASSSTLPRPLPQAGGEVSPALDLSALMMEVVAEKTGYPAAMLSPSMELESDLGVDSIKRVEILAALRERAPGLPELDPAELGKLRTLEEITRLLGASARALPPLVPEAPREARLVAPRAVDRSVTTLVPAPLPGLAPVGLFGAREVAITGDGRGIAERLARLLAAEGIAASVVESAPEDAGALVVLAGLRQGSASDACREAFDAARRVAKRFGEQGGLFVTVQDTGGGLGLEASERAAFAGLTGLAKTAALEWPRATVRAIDVASELDLDLVAERITRELLLGGAAREVGIDASGARRVPSIAACSLPAASAITAPVVVASGGARGVTAACLLALARHAGGRYLLLGRSELVDAPAHLADRIVGKTGAALKRALLEDAALRGERPTPREIDARARELDASREIAATLAAFEAIGVEARYAAVDVRDRDALTSALAGARRAFGPFTTLVHGAGVLADRLLIDKRPEDFERVFATKVDGLDALLEATSSDPLDTLLFFSSVAARYGNAGQSDYAMANAVLDAVAAREAAARPSARVRALAWGPWEGGMVTPELASLFASRGVSLIDLARGADAFVREAASSGSTSCVLGAELAGAQDASERRVEVSVSRSTHGYLVDHVVKDVPVVPVVLVIEWIARAARALKPELVVARVRDVAVLRGLPLARFDEGARFEIALRLVGNGHGATYAAEVRDARGACYRAEVDLLPELPAGAAPRPTPASLEPRTAPIYGGCLFHGERFRVIRRLDGVGEAGAAGELVGTRSVGWGEAGWETDPALFDGGLQLAVLWSERRLGGDALPTGLEALCLYREGPIDGSVRAIAYGHTAASGRAVCDVVFVDEDGRAVAELRGVETHVRPGTRTDAARAR